MLKQLLNPKILTAIVFDIVSSIFAFLLAICLRFETLDPLSNNIENLNLFFFPIVLSQVVAFNFFGLYKGIWRFSSSTDLIRIIKSVLYGTAAPVSLLFVYNRLEGFPRSVFLIDIVLLILMLGGGRFLYRTWKDSNESSRSLRRMKKEDIVNVLIIGAGSAGNQILKEINSNPRLGYNVIGFLDDDQMKHGRTIQSVMVIGNTDDVATIVEKYEVKKIFIAIPSAKGEDLKRIVENCQEARVEFKTLPKINEILSGKVELSLLRNINLDDLLGRDPVDLDLQKIGQLVGDKVVMVTGAGGSIGSELCHQIASFGPKKLVLFEICELFLYRLEMQLNAAFSGVEVIPCIGDVRYKDRIEAVMDRHRPHLVLHAAAYKHVPMMEENPLEAIFTNVLGTRIVSEAACKYDVQKFVMISTDKAVNPTNIMGTTKRVAEMICQRKEEESKTTKFITVRFGNVLGSNGSVVPLFKEQIEQGGPVTVTHEDITRYFMSIPEACQLVIQAATMGNGGEIFVLDMGTPVRIVDLARDLISLAGLVPGEDIEIKYVGLREGEKLYEELFSETEELQETSHVKVRVARQRELPQQFNTLVEELICLKNSNTKKEIYQKIKSLVNEFSFVEIKN